MTGNAGQIRAYKLYLDVHPLFNNPEDSVQTNSSTSKISLFNVIQNLSNLISICHQTGMEYSIIRPPLVYGPNVKGNFEYLLSLLRKELPLPFAGIRNSRSFVFVENLVDLIVKCTKNKAAANQAFLVSDGQDLSTSELINKLVIELKANVSLFKLPRSGFKLVASMLGKRDIFSRLFENLEVNTEKTLNILDWEPPYTINDGLAKTAQYYLKNTKN